MITSSLARVAKKKHKDDAAAAATKMVDDIVSRIRWAAQYASKFSLCYLVGHNLLRKLPLLLTL